MAYRLIVKDGPKSSVNNLRNVEGGAWKRGIEGVRNRINYIQQLCRPAINQLTRHLAE